MFLRIIIATAENLTVSHDLVTEHVMTCFVILLDWSEVPPTRKTYFLLDLLVMNHRIHNYMLYIHSRHSTMEC
jgi:hypothetical protein